MKTKLLPSLLLGTAMLVPSLLQAASVSSDWNLFTSGTHSWETNSHWDSFLWSSPSWNATTATAPQNGTDNFAARVINGGDGNITIETVGAVTIGRLWLENTGTGSTTLKLGGDMTVTGVLSGPPNSGATSRPTGFSNTVSGTPSALVIDVNGHILDAGATTNNTLSTAHNYTIRDTSLSGTGMVIMPASANTVVTGSGIINVENRVTVKMTSFGGGFEDGSGSHTNVGWTFAPDATLWLSATGGNGSTSNLNVAGTVFSNLIVGGEGSALPAIHSIGHSNGNNLVIKGNLTLLNGSTISMNNSGGTATNRMIILSGNMTDEATTGMDYGGRTDRADAGIHFVGGADREQQILIKRQGLTSRFTVGSDADNPGNIALLHNLTTTGTVTVNANSRVDVNTFTLQGGNVGIASNATIALTFGNDVEDAGIIATGRLTLSDFNLELTYDNSGWVDGTDLLLFRYSTLTGTPTLGDITLNGFTYGDLWRDGTGGIWLRDIVAVPEPGALSAIMTGGAMLLIGARLRSRKRALL